MRLRGKGVGGVRWAVLLLLALLLTGCPRNGGEATPDPSSALNQDRSAGAFARTDPWLLTTTDRDAARGNHGIFLGNGYLGATFGADGGAGENAVAYVTGVYQGDDEVLAPIPQWHRLALPEQARRGAYSQTLDLKRGLLTTKSGGRTVTAFLSRDDPHLAVLRTEGGTAGAPPDDQSMTYQAGTKSVTVAVAVSEAPGSGQGTRYVAVYTSREAKDPRARAREAVDAAARAGYDALLARHTAAWERLWEKDIVIEGDPEAQQLVHSLMFNLLSSVRPGGADSIPPETWSGSFYKGHIFWDADVWVFPALLAQHPDLARCLLDYRFDHLDEAKRRAKAAGFAGADFPWESAATGKEVAPGDFARGRHVTAGVGWAHWQYWLATQDRAWLRERGWPVLSAVADYFASRAKKDPATGGYDLLRVMGPDELKGPVDNNTYTNALARYCLRAAADAAEILGSPADPKWGDVAKNITLPYDKRNDRYLARAGDEGGRTKQADGELVLYPAQLPMRAMTLANTFDFHARRPIKHGPAMTASIHALLAARLGRAEAAAAYFRDAYRPFVRGPFLQFSEKRSLDRCYFATGAGGALQSVLYGFGGLRREDFAEATPPRRPVALPPSWKRLTVTGIRHGAKTYTLEVTPQGRTLRPGA